MYPLSCSSCWAQFIGFRCAAVTWASIGPLGSGSWTHPHSYWPSLNYYEYIVGFREGNLICRAPCARSAAASEAGSLHAGYHRESRPPAGSGCKITESITDLRKCLIKCTECCWPSNRGIHKSESQTLSAIKLTHLSGTIADATRNRSVLGTWKNHFEIKYVLKLFLKRLPILQFFPDLNAKGMSLNWEFCYELNILYLIHYS